MYAPNSSTEWALFSRQLVDGLPIVDAWILVGDFNMTLYKEDKVGGMQMVVEGSKLVSWDLLMGRMGMKVAWHVLKKPQSSPSFSRVACSMNGFCMSRIVKFYISSKMENFRTNVEIIAGSPYSDHMLVKITLVRQRRPARECNIVHGI